MYVLAVFESRDQRLVTAQVGHQAQFHLTVIGRKQQVLIVRRDERLPDPASQLVPHGNILQVGIGRGEPSGRCHGLVERRVDLARHRIDQQRQCLHIGRKQLLHAPVFEDLIDDLVFVGEGLQVLLLGRKLLGFGHLGLLRDAELPEEHLAQLPRRIDVERRLVRQTADISLQVVERLIEFDGILGQCLRIDPHPGHLDLGQHSDHRLLDLQVQPGQIQLLDLRPQHLFQAQRHVGILGSVFGHPLQRNHVHSQLPGSLADERSDRNRPVIEVAHRQRIHVVTRLGIEQVMEDHRIVKPAANLDPQASEHHQVELDVLSDLGDLPVGEQRPDKGRIFGRIGFIERNIPRLVRTYRKRKPHDPVVENVESRRFGIKTKLRTGRHFAQNSLQLLRIAHDRIGVGCGLRRGELLAFRRLFIGRRRLPVGCRGFPRIGCGGEQISLPRQRRLFSRCGLRARDFGQLGLGRLTGPFGQRFGRSQVRQIVQEHPEIQFGEKGLQLVDPGGAHRQIFLPKVDRHVQADGRQPLGQQEFVAPLGDLLTLPALDPIGVLQDIFHRPPLLHQLAGGFFPDARHAGNVVRSIAPQRQDVTDQLRILDAVFLADRLPADDFDTVVAFLFVDLTVVAHQLSVVLVGRNHENVVTRLDALVRERADHIVGLVTGHLQHRNTHRLDDPLDIRHRQQDILRRFGTVGLVFGENFAAETAAFRVERDAQQVGMFPFLDVAQKFRETEHHRGIHPRTIAHGTPHERIIILENQCIGIDKKEFFHRILSVILGHPLGERSRRFVQTQGVELDMGRQVGFDAGGEIREHILARRLIIDQHDAAEATADLFRYTGAFGRAAHDESMVEAGEDLFVHNPFQLSEIHHHAELGIRLVGARRPLDRHEQAIGVAVNLAAKAVVTLQRMSRLECKLLGKTNDRRFFLIFHSLCKVVTIFGIRKDAGPGSHKKRDAPAGTSRRFLFPSSFQRSAARMKSMLTWRWKASLSEMKVWVVEMPWIRRIPSKMVFIRCSLSRQ